MKQITFTHGNAPYTAVIVPELPAVGDMFQDADGIPRAVLEVAPWPPDARQESPEVFTCSPWRIHLDGRRYCCVAVREKIAEKM